MLTPALLPPSSSISRRPPSRRPPEMKMNEGLKTLSNVVEHMQHAADRRQPIDEVEETILRDLLVMGNWLLQERSWIWPDLGTSARRLRVATGFSLGPRPEPARLEQPRGRPYLSIFGEVTIERTCYGRE